VTPRRGVIGATVLLAALAVTGPAAAAPGDVDLTEGAEIEDVVLGPDDAFWATAPDSDQILRIDPDTLATTSVTDDLIEAPHQITTGPDGALWFSMGETLTFGRLDPTTHAVTAHAHQAAAWIADLVRGPDGRLWFVESSGYGAVDTADGSVEQFQDAAVPSPQAITLGPDGTDLWIADAALPGIVRIDPTDGDATAHPDPNTRRPIQPHTITVGPDGDLWVASGFGDPRGIAHVNPEDGTFTKVDDGSGIGWWTMTSELDGEVWLAGGDWLARVDPVSGDLDHYAVPPDAGGEVETRALLVDADGEPWLLSGGRLGSIDTGAGLTDATDPAVEFTSPVDGHAYLVADTVIETHDCGDGAGVILECVAVDGRLGSGQRLEPGTPLTMYPTRHRPASVYARDTAGNTSLVVHRFDVDPVCHGQRATVYANERFGFGRATAGPDVIYGANSSGWAGADLICLEPGIGFHGGRGADRMFGSEADDALLGGPGWDRLVGGPGPDHLDGGPGSDVCIGGTGHDTFVNCERVRQGS
jgi:virginiamycin B lyase